MKAVIYKGEEVIGNVEAKNGGLVIEGSPRLVGLINKLRNRRANVDLSLQEFIQKLPDHLRSYAHCEIEE